MAQDGERGISVTGEGFVNVRPDTAYVGLGFSTRNASLVVAQRQTAANMGAVITRLKELGIDEKDIQTSSYNVWRDEQRLTFVVSNSVRVTIRDVEASGALLEAAVDAGANEVRGIWFGVEEREVLEEQARARAMAAARGRAEQLAQLGGVQLGPPVYISENSGWYADSGWSLSKAAPTLASSDMPVESGETRVSVTVQVKYSIL